MTRDLDYLWACVDRHDRTVTTVTHVVPWLVIVASALDLILTRYLLDRGLGYEANGLMAAVVFSWLAVPLKVGLPAVAGWRVRAAARSELAAAMLCVVLGIYAAVVVHNAALVVTR